MPIVPGVPDPQVQTAQLPAGRLSPDAPLEAFGGGAGIQQVAGATQGIIGDVAKIIQEEQEKADQISVLNFDLGLSGLVSRIQLEGEQQRGENAFDLPERAAQEFEKGASELGKRLTTDAQRAAGRRMLMSRRADMDRFVQKHVARERRSFDDTTLEAYMKSEEDAALKNTDDPERLALSIDRRRGALLDYGDRYGIPDQATQLQIENMTSRTHRSVIRQMQNEGRDIDAKNYFDAFKDQMTGKDASEVESLVRKGSLKGEAQRTANVIISELPEDPTMTGAMDEVRKIEDPELQAEVRGLVRQAVSDIQKEREREMDALAERLYDQVQRDGFESLDLDELSRLPRSAEAALRRLKPDQPTNRVKWAEFNEIAAKEDFHLMPYPEFLVAISQLSDQEQKEAVGMRLSARRAAAGDANAISERFADSDMKIQVQLALSSNGLTSFPLENEEPVLDSSVEGFDNQAHLFHTFFQNYKSALTEFEQSVLDGKEKANAEQRRSILDRMFIRPDRVVERGTFGISSGSPGLFNATRATVRERVPGLPIGLRVREPSFPDFTEQDRVSWERLAGGRKLSELQLRELSKLLDEDRVEEFEEMILRIKER